MVLCESLWNRVIAGDWEWWHWFTIMPLPIMYIFIERLGGGSSNFLRGKGFQSDFDRFSRDLLKTCRTKAINEDNLNTSSLDLHKKKTGNWCNNIGEIFCCSQVIRCKTAKCEVWYGTTKYNVGTLPLNMYQNNIPSKCSPID